MSNDVYGYAEVDSGEALESAFERFRSCAVRLGLGLVKIGAKDVYGFPAELRPCDTCVCFRVVDWPGAVMATYLADMVDYAPDAKVRLPHSGLSRIELLIGWVIAVAALMQVRVLVIAASDENEVSGVVTLEVSDVRSRFIKDFIEYAPPNKVYVIRKDEDIGST